jgi:hypothetical protein
MQSRYTEPAASAGVPARPSKLTSWRRFGVARADGSTYVQVLHRLNGKQSSTSFEDLASATRFQKFVDKFDPAKAGETLGMHRRQGSVDCVWAND